MLLNLMLDHLHEPPVIPCLLQLIQASIDNKTMGSSAPTDLVLHLTNSGALHGKIVPRMAAHPCRSRLQAQAASDFLQQYIEKLQAAPTEKAANNWARLLADVGKEGKAVSILAEALTQPAEGSGGSGGRPAWQLSNIALLLHTLLTASQPATITVMDTDVQSQALAQMLGSTASLQKTLTNALHPLAGDIQRSLSKRLPQLCEALTHGDEPAPSSDAASSSASAAAASSSAAPSPSSSPSPASAATMHPAIQFSSYTVTASFTSRRLQLLKLLVTLLQGDLSGAIEQADRIAAKRNHAAALEVLTEPRLFAQVPASTWPILLDWFFRFLHNNVRAAASFSARKC